MEAINPREAALAQIRDKIYAEIGTPPRYKEKIQVIQDLTLAPYATKAPREGSRRNPNERTNNFEARGEFQRDRDRIIHSNAFRRLMYKTQVFVNHEGDYYRTRLTHSLEVAQISRGVARSLAANEDLTEAIALGHDLGHTPFGHAVEELLSEFLKNEHGFYHNEQSVRVVDVLEQKTGTGDCGLNLTWEVREGILKHNGDRTEGLYEDLLPAEPAGLEGQIVGLTDTIAYVCHDLDDGINAGLIREVLREDLLTERDFNETVYLNFGLEPDSGISALINALVLDLVESTWEVLRTNNIASLRQIRKFADRAEGGRIVRLGRHGKAFKALKKFVTEYIYMSPMTTIMDEKAKKIVGEIYHSYWKNPRQLPNKIYKRFADASKGHANYEAPAEKGIRPYDGYVTTPARVICDYITEMTDRSALETYDKLFGPFTRI